MKFLGLILIGFLLYGEAFAKVAHVINHLWKVVAL